jgi:predicted kinase
MDTNNFVENIFNDSTQSYRNTLLRKPIAIFMMGIPGSGKSTVIRQFIRNILPLVLYDLDILGEERFLTENNFMNCNPDKVMEYITGFNLAKKEDFLGRATIYNNKLFKMVILDKDFYGKKYNLIYDATGYQYGHYLKHIQIAKENGYLTILINISIEPVIAFQRIKNRERKVEFEIINKVYNNIYNKKNEKSKYPNKNNLDILSEQTDLYFTINNNGESKIEELSTLKEEVYINIIF